MTEKERADMMAEIMGVVDKHISKSENKQDSGKDAYMPNPDLDKVSISKKEMAAWKEEYRRIRVDGKTILEEVMRNPISVAYDADGRPIAGTAGLESSFDIDDAYNSI